MTGSQGYQCEGEAATRLGEMIRSHPVCVAMGTWSRAIGCAGRRVESWMVNAGGSKEANGTESPSGTGTKANLGSGAWLTFEVFLSDDWILVLWVLSLYARSWEEV